MDDDLTDQVMVRMDPEMHRALKERAAAEERSMAQQVRHIMRLHLAEDDGRG